MVDRRRRRCEIPGCPSFARSGREFCHAHRNTPPDPQPDQLPYGGRLQVAQDEALQARRAEFLARLESGTFRELYGARLGELMAEAAGDKSVNDELGALRYVQAKALAEIEDAEVLARTLATISKAITGLVRLQSSQTGEGKAMLASAIYDLLGVMDGE